jgi:hypothetical protein
MARIVTALDQGIRVEDRMQSEEKAGAELQIHPRRSGRLLRKADHVAPERSRSLQVRHLKAHPTKLVHGADL